MTGRIESMSMGTEKLSERIHTVEFDNQNLLKSFDRLADRASHQEGNLNTIQIMSRDKMISLKEKLQPLESHVQNEDQRLGASVKLLEIYTGQEIQALPKIVVKDLKLLRKLLMSREKATRTDYNITSMCQSQR